MADQADLMEYINNEVNDRMEQAIEDIREKYERLDAEKEAAATSAANESSAPTETSNKQHSSKRTGVGEDEDDEDKEAKEEEQDDDDLDPELRALRAQRLAQLKAARLKKLKQKERGYGDLTEVVEEEFLREVTTAPVVICHFYHREFVRCAVMDKHVKLLARQYPHIKFIKLNAEKAPFMITKLAVRTLPTLIKFCDGIADNANRQIGFEGLGGTDDFETNNLAKKLGLKSEDNDSEDEEYERRDGATYQETLEAMRRKIIESGLADDMLNDV